MPIYEYKCMKCNEDFECIVFNGDIITCPQCETDKVKRTMSACSFKRGGSSSSGDYSAPSSSASSSGCGSCSGGSCATCH